ncbi:hypothetical protein O4J56_19295 [Nocardiopsis sp. RSe5-2]|uniref:DUF222 domain-containing protein n=1 Tax=Nocardiopsis endophytica TaxID=3018445 RepID=A0ABT4U777_9ACTN|nr:hypothetical protein [Nocardiopsis endophytica]MDA2812799.1 hypothetical protein [Nocardiopsis endophytica]
MQPRSSSVFASVRRHFDDPRVGGAVVLTVPAASEGAEPLGLTAAEAHAALYGQGSDPQFAVAVWKEVLRAALGDDASNASDETGKLLVIWLALPRLTGTVHRVCTRLHADRSDVEAEMVLTLLEELSAPDAGSCLSDRSLIRAACTRAWNFARDGHRELPSTQVERIAQDHALTASDGEVDAPAEKGWDVRVDRPDGPDGLRTPLRFRVRPEYLRNAAFTDTDTDTDDETRERLTRHNPPKKRPPGRRVGPRPVRPAGRRA